jgi:hypothetical protein
MRGCCVIYFDPARWPTRSVVGPAKIEAFAVNLTPLYCLAVDVNSL